MIKTHLVRVLFRRTYSKRPRFNNLDDLLKRKTLDDVDPEVIRELINRRTNELNIQQELKLLKQLTQAEKDLQKTSLSKYSKILWIAAIGGSLAFLVNNLMTWKSRYDMREQELAVQMAGFEHELGELLKAKERALEAEKKRGDESPTEIVQTKWYQNWLWR